MQVEAGSEKAKTLAREAAGYMLEAKEYYMNNGNHERALEAIQKSAKVLERHEPTMAMKNYQQLATVTPFLDQAGKVLAIDALREGFQFACRGKHYAEVRETLALF